MKSNHQKEIIQKRNNKDSLWRPGFLFICILFTLYILLTAFANNPSEVSDDAFLPFVSPASGGYSIFHETMVDMTWQEVEKAAKEGAIILFASAVIEEHGPHMSCGIDTYLGYMTCKLLRRELESRGIKTLIAPPFYWGVNSATHVFPGTFTVKTETMKAVLNDIFESLKSWGFSDIFYFNSHGDGQHIMTGLQSILAARKDLNLNIRYIIGEDELQRFGVTGKEPFLLLHKSPSTDEEPQEFLDIHAGALETGLVAAYYPDLVNMELARTLKPTNLTGPDAGEWIKDAKKVTPLGYFGDPANFNVEESKEYWDASCKFIADAIEEMVKKK